MAESSSKTPELKVDEPSFKDLLPGASPEPGAGRAADVGIDLGPSSNTGFKDFSSASIVEGSKDF